MLPVSLYIHHPSSSGCQTDSTLPLRLPVRWKLILTVAICVCTGTSGCGDPSVPEPVAEIEQLSTSSEQDGITDHDASPNVTEMTDSAAAAAGHSTGSETDRAPAARQDTSEVASPDPVSAKSQPDTQSEKSIAAAQSVEGASPPSTVAVPSITATVPVAEPSAEQIAQWTPPTFEPYQLLAFRQSEETGFVTNMVHTADGRHYGLAGTKVTLWSIDGTTPEHVFLDLPNADKEQKVTALAISPDGAWLAAGDSEGTLSVWNLSDRTQRVSKKLYSNDITQIAVSPDSQEIATISYNDEVTVWSANQLEQKNRFKLDVRGVKRIVYMSPDLLVAAGEKTVAWDVRTGKLDHVISSARYRHTLALSADRTLFACGTEDGLQLMTTADAKPTAKLIADFATDELAEFSNDGKQLVTANGSSLRVWDLQAGRLLQIIDTYGWPITGLSYLPGTRLMLVSSVNGMIRIWGTPAAGEPLGFKPIHSPMAMPDASSREPANSVQLMNAVDLRTFPLMPGAVPQVSDSSSLNYSTKSTLEDAQLYCRYILKLRGWTEVAATQEAPGALVFDFSGFRLTASFYEDGQGGISVMLSHGGNFDLRWLPKFDEAPTEPVFENANAVIYRTKADLIRIETSLLRKMHLAGWTAYARLNTSHNEQPDHRHMMFLRNGTTLHITVGKFPADPDSYHISYSRFLTTCSLPVPPDSGFVEYDGSTQPLLVALTSMNLAQTREFYDRELASQGWVAHDARRVLKEDSNWLSFLQGQKDLIVGLEVLDNGMTRVRIGEGLEDASWQLSKPKAEDPEKAAVAIEAADFPILNPAKIATYDSEEKSIEIKIEGKTLPDVATLYTKELMAAGWIHDGRGINSDDYVFLTFEKGSAEIQLRARLMDTTAVIGISGDGLRWTKPLPGGKQVISYEAWLRTNRHPAGLSLLDNYEKEMRTIAGSVPAEKP